MRDSLFAKLAYGLSLISLLLVLTPSLQAMTEGEPEPQVDPDLFQIQEDEWELLIRTDGIETYRMRHKGTDVQTFKGVAFVDAKIEVVGEVFRDIASYPQWMHKFHKTKVLKELDRNTYVFWTGVKTPFPYKNRDLVIENATRYNFDNGTAELEFWAAQADDYPAQRGYVRIPLLEGTYWLEYFGRDKTRVSYQYRSDPGGNIPLRIANWIEIRHFPYHTLKGLQQMVLQQKYIDSGRQSPEYQLLEDMLDDRHKQETILRNRLYDYITDRFLIETIFALPETQALVDQMYQERASFSAIRVAMVGLFKTVSQKLLSPANTEEERATFEQLQAHLQDKPIEEFFALDKFMSEHWLLQELTQDGQMIQALWQQDSPVARLLFEKITTSEAALKNFIRRKSLAYRILEEPEVRQKLWQDQELRRQLSEEFAQINSLQDFEALIRQRVESY